MRFLKRAAVVTSVVWLASIGIAGVDRAYCAQRAANDESGANGADDDASDVPSILESDPDESAAGSAPDEAVEAEEDLPPADSESTPPKIDEELESELPEAPLGDQDAEAATESPAADSGENPSSPSGRARRTSPFSSRSTPDPADEPGTEPQPTPATAADETNNNEGDAEIIAQETIKERYEGGEVKVERGVSQDEHENYVNHGPWKMFDPQGEVIAEGIYRFGQRDGAWMRVYQVADAEIFSAPPFTYFTAPFVSRASFRHDKLHGHWTIEDQTGKKICDWSFVDGRRDGESVWFYHTGQRMRVIHYRQGQIHGDLTEWDVNGKEVKRVEYQDGRLLAKQVESNAEGQKVVEGTVLHARLVMKDADDWWNVKLATYSRQGEDQKHGEWKAWYPDGQVKFTGTYQYNKPHGKFTWWHANGQRSLEAQYEQGRKFGAWTWWHANGQKSIQGQYANNAPSDRWVWWHESGKVAQRVDFSAAQAANGQVIQGSGSHDSIILREPQNQETTGTQP